jgi:hypothetical protein
MAAGFLLLTGCPKGVGTVSGTVKYAGKNLKGGNVTFIPPDGSGQTFSGTIGEDGTYSVSGVASGTYKVCVETKSLRPGGDAGGGYKGSGGAAAPKPKAKDIPNKPLDAGTQVPEGYTPSNPADAAASRMNKRYVQIPDKYSEPDNTDLTFTVSSGENKYDIDLK